MNVVPMSMPMGPGGMPPAATMPMGMPMPAGPYGAMAPPGMAPPMPMPMGAGGDPRAAAMLAYSGLQPPSAHGRAPAEPVMVRPDGTQRAQLPQGGSVLGSILKFAGIGAAGGFVAGMVLPFLGNITGALLGAVGGAVLGLMRARKAAATALPEPMPPTPAVRPNRKKPARAAKRARSARPVDRPTTGKRKTARRVSVRRGDTLGKLARKHDTTVAALRSANPTLTAGPAADLQPGIKLRLP